MGFFADQRIKNGKKASQAIPSLPKNTTPTAGKPLISSGTDGMDVPSKKSYSMSSNQQAFSRRFPR